jgi:hypothetical protein
MKTIIKESLKQLIADRRLLVLISAMLLLALTSAIIIWLSIHSSEKQLVSHYSRFGVGYYTDQWFYLYVFVAFELIVAALHSIVATKLLIVRGRSIAVTFAWLGIGIELLGWVTALTVIKAYI